MNQEKNRLIKAQSMNVFQQKIRKVYRIEFAVGIPISKQQFYAWCAW